MTEVLVARPTGGIEGWTFGLSGGAIVFADDYGLEPYSHEVEDATAIAAAAQDNSEFIGLFQVGEDIKVVAAGPQ